MAFLHPGILLGRQFRSNLSILPSQLTNRTAYIHEEIAKKESKLHEKPTCCRSCSRTTYMASGSTHQEMVTTCRSRKTSGATFLLHYITRYYSHVQEKQKSSETLTSSRYSSQYNNHSISRRYTQGQTSYLHSTDKL